MELTEMDSLEGSAHTPMYVSSYSPFKQKSEFEKDKIRILISEINA